jgi:FkbM family methyltransferase
MRSLLSVVGRFAVDAFLRAVPTDYVLRRSAELLGVSAIGVEGELGYFQGSARDQAVQGRYLRDRTWAPELQALFERILKRGGTLVDVGANIGLTTVPIARKLGVRCYAFEPDPDNFRYLVSNIAANGVTTAKPFNLAVMPREGVLSLERSTNNMGDHRIRMGDGAPGEYDEQHRTIVEVRGARLDAVLENEPLASPVVLKVDTQGAEVQVLRAAAGLLPRVDHAVLEFWPYGLRRMGDSPEAFYELVAEFPFGAVLQPDAPPTVLPIRELTAELRRRIPQDGTSTEHADVWVSRVAELPS